MKVDSTGRLHVTTTGPATRLHAGLAFNDAGQLLIATSQGNRGNGSHRTGDDGAMSVTTAGPVQVFNHGWPMMSNGDVLVHLDAVPTPGTPMVNGIAVDAAGLFCTTDAPTADSLTMDYPDYWDSYYGD